MNECGLSGEALLQDSKQDDDDATRLLSKLTQLERANWSRQEMGSLAQSGSLVPVYDTGSGTDPIDISILGSVTNTEWTWLRASPEPLSDRMRRDP